jgi:hypothetical protein
MKLTTHDEAASTATLTRVRPSIELESARHAYAPPRLTRLAVGVELLELLGPAQAGYGGGGGVPSDRALKTDVEAVDPGAVLAGVAALPVSAWRYRHEDAGVRHLGPMAQDFRAAFGLGTDDESIQVVDATGVSLAAVKALLARVEALEARLAEVEGENERLRRAPER